MGAGFLQVLLAGVLAVAMGEEYWQKYFFYFFMLSYSPGVYTRISEFRYWIDNIIK